MTITLTIELSDELEQQVMVEAKQQQVSPESIVLQSLSQTFSITQIQVQNEEPESREIPTIQSDMTDKTLDPLEQFIGATFHL